MNISSYDPCIFASVPDFQTASRHLNRTKECLQALGGIICRFGFQEHIGVSLLHKHFPILLGEQLIKHFDDNCAYIRPYPQSTNGDVVPYLWKFDHDRTTFYPLEFIDTGQRASRGRTDAHRFVNSEIFLTAFSAKLCELGLADVFGPCVRHGNDEILLDEGEILLETTDFKNRVLTLAAAPENSMETTETSWVFFRCDKGRKNVTQCLAHCVSHCNVHFE